jgi:3-deoxy-D-manno-octulosonic-acid transferase
MSFFKWYGGLQQKMLSRFDRLFVQNASSKKLLDDIGLANITTISGDTRFDRVMEIAATNEPLPLIEKFVGRSKVIIAGSTWPSDEAVLVNAWRSLQGLSLKLLIAPHEISKKHIGETQEMFPGSILYSSLANGSVTEGNILIIDNIGMLSRLYRYGWLTYVGGGFIKMGVHNVLEPAVFAKPVLLGPFYQKYYEAIELVETGGAIVIENDKKFAETAKSLFTNSDEYAKKAAASEEYVSSKAGATGKIIQFIQEKRLLTS